MAWTQGQGLVGVCQRCEQAKLVTRVGSANDDDPTAPVVVDRYCDGCGCVYERECAKPEDMAA